ncbi:hypothetical protein SAMN05192555_109100 [Franzmannia pantelleriensis]|uniref:Uncharacterized protein n=1 Tax=Franzmannia pantelleriensis TaxID=48727 RepID=A0A1G9QEU4_9GAMM|nr:hypothetical protein SAMN05192555_109100 [Halomonas pantelleriensis]
MYHRIAFPLLPCNAYYRGYGSWRFSGVRSAQLATSGREIIGGHSTRCSTPCTR